MSRKKDRVVAEPAEDDPAWSAEDFRNARPALDVVAEMFGLAAADTLKRGRGRPPKDGRKVNQTLRLDPDVLQAYRHEGSGWQSRINDILRQHMPHRNK